MEGEAIEQVIIGAIRKVKPELGTIALDARTQFESLGLTSLERAIVVFEIEDHFDVPIMEEAQDRFRTVGEARDVVARMLASKATGGG